MKNNIIRIFVITLIISGLGCKKQLEEVPKSIISPDQFFTTQDECIQAVNGVYRLLPDLFDGFINVTEIGADDILQDKNDGNVSQLYEYSPSAQGGAAIVWTDGYRTIMDANLVINRLKSAPISDTVKNRLIGEAKFVRGMQYYFLANTFGDVPLWTNELDINEISKLPRSPVADVRNQVVSDLKDAASSLPNRFTGEDVGRANKAAALTLLAKEYLVEEKWAEASAAAESVLQMPEYALMNNYGDNFDLRNCKESIFEIQFLRDPVLNVNYTVNTQSANFLPPLDKTGVYAGVNFGSDVKAQSYANYYPTQKFVSLFDSADLRKNSILAYGYNGKQFNRLNENGTPYFGPKFWDLEANNAYSGKNLPFLRLADDYMIVAEAQNELGNTGPALEAVNMIRERAGLDALSGLSQDTLRQEIMKEDAIEFCGEFTRKWDLIRWGKLIDAVKSVAIDNPEGAANIDSHFLVYPISEDELIKNPALEQNPGY
jgi:hypothetical protein